MTLGQMSLLPRSRDDCVRFHHVEPRGEGEGAAVMKLFCKFVNTQLGHSIFGTLVRK